VRKAVHWMVLATWVALSSPVLAEDGGGNTTLKPFVLDDSNGKAFDMGKHIGREVIVMAFWATWCKPCKLELAALNKLYLKYKDQGMLFVAVSIDGPDSIAQVQNYVKKFGYTFPVILDRETAVLERYNPRGDVPFSMVVNRKGVVVDKHQGYNPGDEIALEVKLKTLLAEGHSERSPALETPIQWFPSGLAQLEGTESLRFRYLYDDPTTDKKDDRVYGIFNRLSVNAVHDPFRLGIRADSTVFPGYECVNGDCNWEDDHRIERYWMHYKNRRLEVRGGDFYHSMGRGLVFSIRKIDELGVDTTVRGGFARGSLGPVKLTGFGGLSNIQNIDTVFNLGLIPDPDDLVAGGEAAVALPGNLSVGVRSVYVDYVDEKQISDKKDLVVGANFSAPELTENVSFYVETAFINKYEALRVIDKKLDKSGYALYSSLSVRPVEGLAILLEGKAYSRFEVRNPYSPYALELPTLYHEPPTLERFDQQVPGNRNSVGGRLRVEYYLKDQSLLLYMNAVGYSFALEGVEKDFERYEWIDSFGDKGNWMMHAYAGFEKRWAGGYFAQFSGGWRNEAPNKPGDDQPDFSRRLWHVESDVQVPIVGKHAVGLRTNHRNESKLFGDKMKDFFRGDAALTYSFAPNFSMGIIWSYQTEFEPSKGPRYKNFAGEVFYRFSDWGQIGVFGGRVPAGIICVSGVCRDLPSFYGVKSEFVARF
jgi:peroxiredoxin